MISFAVDRYMAIDYPEIWPLKYGGDIYPDDMILFQDKKDFTYSMLRLLGISAGNIPPKLYRGTNELRLVNDLIIILKLKFSC